MGNNKYKREHRNKGLCANCSEPVIFPSSKCEVHRKHHAYSERKLKAKRKLNNQCSRCGASLHPEMDEGKTNCITCREHLI